MFDCVVYLSLSQFNGQFNSATIVAVRESPNGDSAFVGRGHPKQDRQSELVRVRQENKKLDEENETGKEVAGYFPKELPSTAWMQKVRIQGWGR